MLGGAALAGLAFVHRPWPNRLDVWGYRFLPASFDAGWAHDLATLGSLTALVIGVIAIFLVGVLRDWVRAIACAAAPVVAVLIVQDLAKPLVGRHIGIAGGSSYPSGTVAAVAALATAATQVMPRMIRPLIAVVGLVATIGTSVAVIVLRWHYPTDAGWYRRRDGRRSGPGRDPPRALGHRLRIPGIPSRANDGRTEPPEARLNQARRPISSGTTQWLG
jgi:membrane-associated phospholipid phosphatase